MKSTKIGRVLEKTQEKDPKKPSESEGPRLLKPSEGPEPELGPRDSAIHVLQEIVVQLLFTTNVCIFTITVFSFFDVITIYLNLCSNCI